MRELILSPEELSVLGALASDTSGASRLIELAARTKIALTQLSAIVHNLVEYDLAAATGNVVSLTPQGFSMIGRTRSISSRTDDPNVGDMRPKKERRLRDLAELERSLDAELEKLK